MDKIDFTNPEYYENRELSWIKFDQRVLEEARDKNIPLLERVKFLSIVSSNLYGASCIFEGYGSCKL